MRSETSPCGQRERTFIETARRGQIAAAAIETIAELGYGQASLTRIARTPIEANIACTRDHRNDLIAVNGRELANLFEAATRPAARR
jgi:hypothetical protein